MLYDESLKNSICHSLRSDSLPATKQIVIHSAGMRVPARDSNIHSVGNQLINN